MENYECLKCSKLFTTQVCFEAHIKNIHDLEKSLSCGICGYAFAHKTHLDKHRQTPTDKRPFSCDNCDKSFRTQSRLTDHSRHIHQFGKKHDECKK